MTTHTITTAVNIDSLATKTGSDTYNINGGYLTVDQHTRYGTNQNTSAAMGNITLSATLGGTVEFNSTAVRIIPYDTGTGVVPALGTVISQGSASGILLGVYQNLASAPTSAGAAMPATGFVQIRQWNGNAYAAGALSGISANATDVDMAGWLEIVGVDALTVTVNRLNTFKVRGDWFNLGTTSGSRATTYQIPSNGSTAVYLPGVWVETAVGSDAYEFYPCSGSRKALLANVATDAVRGKFCWISTTGLLRFGNDGTNSTGGYLPASGLRVRIPNIFFVCCTAAALTANVLPNATLTTRYEFATTGGGVIDIDKASFNWYLNFSQPFSVSLNNTGILTSLNVSEVASPINWSHVGVGQEAANAQFGLSMSLCFAGGTMSNCTWTRATLAAASTYVVSLTDCKGFTFNNVRAYALVARGNATTGVATLTRVANCTWNNAVIGGGRVLLTTCSDVTYNNSVYYDHPATTTTTANPMFAFDLSTGCVRIKIDGLTFGGLVMCQPYSGILNVGTAGCTDIKLRNLGTYSSPLDMGDARRTDAQWSRTTVTATVTSPAHGLKLNDIVYVITSPDVTAITVGAKTVASASTPNTFAFSCLNAGLLSGVLSYYPTMAGLLFSLAAGAAANEVEVKRCYTPHLRTNLYTLDNSNKNVLVENVMADYVNVPLTSVLNHDFKGVFATPSLAAQTSCYGTHWFDCFTSDNSPVTGSVPWSRVTTTAFLTSSNHLLRTGESITVVSSSATANQAVTLGVKAVTSLSGSIFSIPATNSGATTGFLDFKPLSGRVGILMNESTTDTVDQYSIVTGSAAFTSAGGLYMPTVGQKVMFVTPNYVLGHEGFAIAPPVMAGGTITNYDITYAIDKNDGNGYGSGSSSGTFHNYYYQRAGGGGTNGATNVTMLSTAGVEVGDYVFGTNVAPKAKVTQVTNGTTIVVDRANVGTVSGLLSFSYLPNESVNPATGFKKKVQIAVSASNATAITSLFAYTLNSNTSRANLYPLDLVPLTITNLKNPSEVRVFDYNTTTSIAGTENVVSGTFTTYIDAGTYPVVDIAILSLGYQNLRFLSQSLGSGLTLQSVQVVDRQYGNN